MQCERKALRHRAVRLDITELKNLLENSIAGKDYNYRSRDLRIQGFNSDIGKRFATSLIFSRGEHVGLRLGVSVFHYHSHHHRHHQCIWWKRERMEITIIIAIIIIS